MHARATFIKQSYYAPVPLFNSAVNARKYRDDLRYDYLDTKQASLGLPHIATVNYPFFFFFFENTSYPKINKTFTCRPAIKAVKMSGCKNIIIDCSYDILASVLKQAQQVGIMSERYKVFVTSLVRITSNSFTISNI